MRSPPRPHSDPPRATPAMVWVCFDHRPQVLGVLVRPLQAVFFIFLLFIFLKKIEIFKIFRIFFYFSQCIFVINQEDIYNLEKLSFFPINYNALVFFLYKLSIVLLCPHELPFYAPKPLLSVKVVNSNGQPVTLHLFAPHELQHIVTLPS